MLGISLGSQLDPFGGVRYCLYILIVFLCSFLFYHSLSLEFGLFLVVTSVHRFVSVVSGVLFLPDSSLQVSRQRQGRLLECSKGLSSPDCLVGRCARPRKIGASRSFCRQLHPLMSYILRAQGELSTFCVIVLISNLLLQSLCSSCFCKRNTQMCFFNRCLGFGVFQALFLI